MIIRSIRTQNYSVIPNLLIDDKNLDWKELGLLVYLLSKPDEWEVSVKHLQKQRKAGRDAILNMLKALRNAGYVVMKNRHEGGVDYVVYDTPQKREIPQPENTEVEEKNSEPLTEKPLTDNPEAGKPTNGKSGYIVNTEVKTNTEKEEVKTEDKQIRVCETVLQHLNKKTGAAYRSAESNNRLIIARLNEGNSLQDLLDVIDMKCEEWTETKFAKFLRPSTLFGAEKFNQYVGELPIWKKEKAGDFSWVDGDYIEGEVVNG